ncbi:LacI family DNA-binding transcriptional regulator [Egicoccus sp. AB-alg6-2]|uniref:LacI family DNA-binding transcriptional regulator n=1 Tax=Egicoccus sp. AB-alg6-2 TaxID=3242692 RepID=UPI00359EA4B0
MKPSATRPVTSRPTMHDVAKLAGVSLKTVSRVVNKEPTVRTATLERVNDAITALGFQRNDLARSLRPGQTSSTIGLVIGDVGNPFFSGIARAVEDVAREHDHLLVAGSSGEDPRHERELLATLYARRVDGILVVPAAGDHSFLAPEIARGLHVVFVDRPPVNVDADAVLLDNLGGARRGVEHLIAQGHRRIGLLADDPDIYTARERIRGYHDAIAAAGLTVDPTLLRLGCSDVVAARDEAAQLLELDEPPTAIFAVNNRMSLGALRALHDRPDRVIALVGFDELEYADMLRTPVTVVAHDPQAMGRRAAEVMFERLDGDHQPVREIVLPTTLRIRGSGEVKP